MVEAEVTNLHYSMTNQKPVELTSGQVLLIYT
jgi:hypothetical protein